MSWKKKKNPINSRKFSTFSGKNGKFSYIYGIFFPLKDSDCTSAPIAQYTTLEKVNAISRNSSYNTKNSN